MSKVIKRFPYTSNGYTIERLNVGDERDFGDATASLIEAGFIVDEIDSNGGDTGRQPRPNNSRQRKT